MSRVVNDPYFYRRFNFDSPEEFDLAMSFNPITPQGTLQRGRWGGVGNRGQGIGGSPEVNEEAARLGMEPVAKRYLDEQDRQRQMAGLLYSAPMGMYNYLFGD
jgi:hypothetical protein